MKISYLLMIFLLAACSPQVETTEEAQNTTETTLPAAAEPPPIVKECSLLLGFDAWEPYQYAYVMFRQESVTPEQLAAFNAELKRVKASDDYEDLMAKYSY